MAEGDEWWQPMSDSEAEDWIEASECLDRHPYAGLALTGQPLGAAARAALAGSPFAASAAIYPSYTRRSPRASRSATKDAMLARYGRRSCGDEELTQWGSLNVSKTPLI